jgi:hypothetical protein
MAVFILNTLFPPPSRRREEEIGRKGGCHVMGGWGERKESSFHLLYLKISQEVNNGN